MVSGERYHVDTNKLLERLNEQLSSENKMLRELLENEKKLSGLLLQKLNIRERIITSVEEFEPIGGFTPLKNRVKNAESESRKALEKRKEDASKISETNEINSSERQ